VIPSSCASKSRGRLLSLFYLFCLTAREHIQAALGADRTCHSSSLYPKWSASEPLLFYETMKELACSSPLWSLQLPLLPSQVLASGPILFSLSTLPSWPGTFACVCFSPCLTLVLLL
jgi:hypothetical protein